MICPKCQQQLFPKYPLYDKDTCVCDCQAIQGHGRLTALYTFNESISLMLWLSPNPYNRNRFKYFYLYSSNCWDIRLIASDGNAIDLLQGEEQLPLGQAWSLLLKYQKLAVFI